MSLMNILKICESSLKVESEKIRIHTNNLSNSESIEFKNGKYYPYTAKMAILESCKNNENIYEGVKIKKIVNIKDPYKKVYNPSHPLSDSNGYLKLPNVNFLNETLKCLEAHRRYEANLEILKATKNIIMKTLSISD
ncbi:flagellar basal body rod protein FlgC [Buchnera aphidicola (Ceratoglyphina bambusae)]|uniref:flagellar basal body rod protein FlgC n=1 Tax=Buchnera aphidicola TaxID=9 RepID=UPI0031B867FF